MQFTSIVALLFSTAAVAAPAPTMEKRADLCSSGSPVCCATDILDLADLDCAPPPTTPSDVDSFVNTCAGEGQQAKCCLLPVLGQALVCSDVNPTTPAANALA